MNLITIQQINDYLLCFLFIQLLIIMTEIQRNIYDFNNDLSEDAICGEYPFVRAFNYLPGQIYRDRMSAWRWDHDGANNRCPENEKKKLSWAAEWWMNENLKRQGPKVVCWETARENRLFTWDENEQRLGSVRRRGELWLLSESPWWLLLGFLSQQTVVAHFFLFFLLLNCFWSSRLSNRPPTKHRNSLTDCMKVALL